MRARLLVATALLIVMPPGCLVTHAYRSLMAPKTVTVPQAPVIRGEVTAILSASILRENDGVAVFMATQCDDGRVRHWVGHGKERSMEAVEIASVPSSCVPLVLLDTREAGDSVQRQHELEGQGAAFVRYGSLGAGKWHVGYSLPLEGRTRLEHFSFTLEGPRSEPGWKYETQEAGLYEGFSFAVIAPFAFALDLALSPFEVFGILYVLSHGGLHG